MPSRRNCSASVRGSAGSACGAAAGFADLQTYETFYTAYLDLKAGRIDALVGDKTFIEYIVANDK